LQVEAGNRPNVEDSGPQKTTDQRADDADHDRDQAAAGIFSRHNELCDTASHQPEQDPGQNIHRGCITPFEGKKKGKVGYLY
jgi:hypothetical protein